MKSLKRGKIRKRLPKKFWILWCILLVIFITILSIAVYSRYIHNNTDINEDIPIPTSKPIINLPKNPEDILLEMDKYRIIYQRPYYDWIPRYTYSVEDIDNNQHENGADPENNTPEAEWVDLYPEIPLENEVEFYIYEKCKEYGLKFQMVLGLIYAESEFNHRCRDNKNTNGTYDVGLFQINSNNFEWMERVFGKKWDEYMLYDNIDAGLYILNYAQSVTDNEHGMLMVYNMGETGAKKKWSEGVLTTPYSRKVMEFADNLPKIEYDEVKNE